jgi:ketosteroid isomerase-like protein
MKDEQATETGGIVSAMEAAFRRKDLEGIVALFAEDATIESYLVARVFDREHGVCRGHAEIRELVGELLRRGTPWGGHGPTLVAGHTLAVEYTRAGSSAERFSVDVIDVKDGKIQSLRAYAGWRAVMALTGEAKE